MSVFLLWGAQAQAQQPPAPPPPVRMVSVSGEARQEFAPDRAVMNASLVSRHKTLAEAKKHNDALMAKLVGIAKEFKIPQEKVKASNVYISPEYRYDSPSNQQEFVGYVVNRSVILTLDDISLHERVLSALVDAKIDQVGGVEFTLKNPEEQAMALREKAVANARAKAELLARAAGAKLGQPMSISEAGAAMPMPPMPMMAMARADMAEKSAVAPSLPGLVSLSETVNITFALE